MSQMVLVDVEDLRQIHKELLEIKELIQNGGTGGNDDQWITSEEMRKMLKISKRTEITYRQRSLIPY